VTDVHSGQQQPRGAGRHRWRWALFAAAAAAVHFPAHAGEIKVGMSGALTGPAKDLGLGMRAGIEACFAQANAQGGIGGNLLRLVALDDGYEPEQAAKNLHKLIDEEKVFALLGNTGTPTAAVAAPIANQRRVPFFGAYTGAGLLRKTPPDRYVINFRASYAQETAEMVRGLLGDLKLKPEDLAFFTQNDAYGDAGYNGAIAALRAAGFADAERLLHERYPRNTTDIEDALAQMIDPTVHLKAVIMIGASKPCAKFIRLARHHGLRALFVNVSFVNGDSLRDELGASAEGVIVTQVVPPLDSNLTAVREYREAVPLARRGFVSLEGFLAARAFVEALRRSPPERGVEAFIDSLESDGPLDLGLSAAETLSKARHQLSDRVWPTIVRGGSFHTLRNWKDATSGAVVAR
jgi:branched-chain amino acid transport system substrate-binding protein